MPNEGWLRELRATFVTLKQNGQLRGCIGMLEATLGCWAPMSSPMPAPRPSATPRFKALTQVELASLEIEVSVLSRPARVIALDHADLLRQLEPGKDGLIIESSSGAAARRGTFLPQVWERAFTIASSSSPS